MLQFLKTKKILSQFRKNIEASFQILQKKEDNTAYAHDMKKIHGAEDTMVFPNTTMIEWENIHALF